MNWSFMIVAMLPEHLLLAGIVVLITLDVLDVGQKHAAMRRDGRVHGVGADRGAARDRPVPGFAVPGALLGRPADDDRPRRSCWR